MSKIKNPIDEIKKAIPELENISDYNNKKSISYKNWEKRLKTISTKNLIKYGKSKSWISLRTYFNPCVICINGSYNTVEINKEKYKLIRQYVMSKEFALQ